MKFVILFVVSIVEIVSADYVGRATSNTAMESPLRKLNCSSLICFLRLVTTLKDRNNIQKSLNIKIRDQCTFLNEVNRVNVVEQLVFDVSFRRTAHASAEWRYKPSVLSLFRISVKKLCCFPLDVFSKRSSFLGERKKRHSTSVMAFLGLQAGIVCSFNLNKSDGHQTFLSFDFDISNGYFDHSLLWEKSGNFFR